MTTTSADSPPKKKPKTITDDAVSGDAATLLNLQPSQIVRDAGGSEKVYQRLLEFAEELKEQVRAAEPSQKEQQEQSPTAARACCNCRINTEQLTKCGCFFEKDGYIVSGTTLCNPCQEQQLETGTVSTCHVCQQLLCHNGCNPLQCGDCTNVMCSHHSEGCDVFKKCMCGKKLWCSTCSKSIDAQVKSGITTDCDDCHRVSCGNADCTIYKACRMCYRRLCENCVYRTNCDCDETLPLCAACLEKYVCPNPNCAGPSGDVAALLLSELSE